MGETPNPQQNDTTPFIVKVVVAIILGPKVSSILAQHGIQLDPVATTAAVAGLLHKLHLSVQKATGWDWL